MVARRMGSREGDTNCDGRIQTETQMPNQDPLSSPLARRGSLYSLTLDEVQNQLGDLGKPLSSMNLDELLKSVWTDETNYEGVGYDTATHQPPPSSSGLSLNQNPGLMLSLELSKKTVDEVWQDIQDGHKRSNLDRKATLGEITLEDFLVKAGIVAESSGGRKNLCSITDTVGLSQQAQWIGHQAPSMHSQQQPNMLPLFMPSHQNFALAAYPETQISMSSSPLMGTLSDTQTPLRKRVAPDDIAEKSVERRQKRMIKNRESAARSRARKQAYTNELESKVSRLEDENEKLRRQQELEKLLPTILPLQEPRYQLRRTSSAPL